MLRLAWFWRQRGLAPVDWMPFVLLFVALSSAIFGAELPPNGISVGPPKVFDNRTLQIMLDQLNEQLRTVQVVDQQKLVQSLANQQGAEVSDVSRSVSLTTPVQPGVVTKEVPNAEGILKPTERTTTQAALTPAAPALPDLIAAPSYTPTFGPSAPDLLADQVSLSYQIFNVRMLLERSLTDRLWNGDPRLQAVLGFQVSLNPPKWARDHAAYVEITVTPRRQDPMSLVALMPFEKTYNSSALSSRSNDFGGSAVARIFTLGYHERRRQQIFYLFRDADTLALGDLQNADSKEIIFGWTFRPVLGRRSVTPGVRQMFAVVSLPASDLGSQGQVLDVRVRTYWRRYSHRTLTAKAKQEDVVDWEQPLPLTVYSSKFIEERLQPVIENVDWTATGSGAAVVTITGRNFFPGTRILLGNTIYDSLASGLLIKSDKTVELRTTQREIASGDAMLSGRYGRPKPVHAKSRLAGSGILINSSSSPAEPSGEKVVVTVVLQERSGGDLALSDRDQPLVTVNDQFIPGPYHLQQVSCEVANSSVPGVRNCVRLDVAIPVPLLAADAVLGIRVPFRGLSWFDSQLIKVDRRASDFKVVRLGGDDKVKLAIRGVGFTNQWKVRIDRTYDAASTPPLEVIGSTLLMLEVDKKVADNKKLIVVPDNGTDPVFLDIPAATPPTPKPTLDTQPPSTATKGSSPSVVFTGNNLGAIKKALFEGQELYVRPSEDGKQITVFLSRKVTKELGSAVVLLEAADGSRIPANLMIVP